MTEIITKINDFVGKIVWGPASIAIIIGTGLFLSIRTGFFQLFLSRVFKGTLGSLKSDSKSETGISPFASMSAALGGTLGIGNIVGVATAIVTGGPGAVFWMWVSAIFGMITKYSEVLLACLYRKKDENGSYIGGPMYYMKDGLKSKILPVLFSIFCVLASFGTGNISQVNAISTSLNTTLNIPLYISGIITAIFTGIIISGGMKRITSLTEKMVPIMGGAYAIAAIAVLFVNYRQIPEVFGMIFKYAFNTDAVLGGGAGYVMANAIRYGVSRGVFSNEAGLGSAPIAHSTASFSSPVKQGMWGIFEVFFDTIVICSLTAFVILSSGLWDSGDTGIVLTSNAFASVFGEYSKIVLSIFSVFFALSSIICWAYYGEVGLKFLFKKKSNVVVPIYRIIFIIVVFIGSISSVNLVFDISDTLNGLMTIPNIIAILLLSPKVVSETKKFVKQEKEKKEKLKSK